MSKWNDILAVATRQMSGSSNLFFRGQSNSSWPLLPGLGRLEKVKKSNLNYIEGSLYFDFLNLSGPLLPEDEDSWRTIFLMQHHGLPARLLDWTGSFGVALYFALKGANPGTAASVWILNPFKLNEKMLGRAELFTPTDLKFNYEQVFIAESMKLEFDALALAPRRHHSRLFSQGGYFTLHKDLEKGLEVICPACVNKIDIPPALFPEARAFVNLAGINEFSLFPDLDGLCRHLYRIDIDEQ